MGGIFLVFVEGVGLVVHLFWKDFREKQQLEVKWSESRLCRYASRYFLCSHLYSILLVVFEYSIFYYLVRAVRATIYFVQTSCLLIHCVLVFILFFLNAIDSIWKKSICGSIFEFDVWNHALVCVQILFRIIPLILAHGSTLETRLSLCPLAGIFCLLPRFLLCFYPYSLFHFLYDLRAPICISGCVLGGSFTLAVSERVEVDSLQHLLARYCPLMSPLRSTTATSFSPDGKTLASTHGDHTVKIIDCHIGSCLKVLTGH